MKSLVLFLAAVTVFSMACAQTKLMVCYLGSWATYRSGNGKFEVEDINPHLCTHAIYSFIGVSWDASIRIIDSWQDISKGGFQRFNNLRNINPNLKTLVAIGGWNEGSSAFSYVCADANLRGRFVNNLYNFVKQYGFNGLDLDWEYPAQRGGAAADKANFVLLMRELRAKFAPEGLLLTAAVSANVGSIATSYDVRELANNLNFINLMTYDFHGSWELRTGHNSPLYPSNVDADRSLNADATVNRWIQEGAPSSKLVLGIGLYGRSFTLQSPTNNGLSAPTTGAGVAGPYTQEPGFLGYNEICELQKQPGWTTRWDSQQQVPYAFKQNLWVGYDNVESVRIKAEYIRNKNLAGAMVWSVETDDFRNICGTGAYPLINKIKSTMA